jgi:hypothetical protein
MASDKAKQSAFKIEIIKTDEEIARDRCDRLNKSFLNKKFKPIEGKQQNHFSGSSRYWYAKCDNFFDKVDVVFEDNRIAITFNLEFEELNALYSAWQRVYSEFEFHGFKYYWNGSSQDLLLYKHDSFDWCDVIDDTDLYAKHNEGITSVINKYRQLARK